MIEFMRAAVRPVVTVGIVAAQIVFIGWGVVVSDFAAAKEMSTFTGIVLTYWFLDRAMKRAGQGAGNGGS